ncbi:ABC transporter permease [Synechocystis sp. CS-94]|nr:Oligopeptide transport system permease protein OppB [Synechocystis sp. PCC 6714]MCT0253593.1 ABC transporter permease [Synechocystis sp. CS-94]
MPMPPLPPAIGLICKRLAIAVVTLLGISLVIFSLLALAPGNPLGELATNPSISQEVRDNLRRSLGLDQPLPIRYLKWLWSLLQGDLGYSFTSRSPVIDLIGQRLPTTLWLMGTAYLISLAIAIPLGIIAAVYRGQWWEPVISGISLMGFSLPTFLTGLLFILIFSVQLRWLPFIYDSTLAVNSVASLGEQIRQLLMPVAVLVFYQSAVILRFVRSAVLEELPQNYIRTAYAKGLGTWGMLKNHLLKNASLPLITLMALDVPTIFTGALVTEQVFRVPGIGALLIESIYRSDTPVVMAVTFLYAMLIVFFSGLADLIYQLVDPRIRW